MHDDELNSILAGTVTPYTTDEQEAKGPVRFIDIHIYDLPEEDEVSPIVESTSPLEASEAVPVLPHTRKLFVSWLVVCLCLLAITTLIAVFYLVPLFTLQATITIVPLSRQLPSVHTMLHIVNGSTQGNQIPGRLLPVVSMSQQQTAKATGAGHQDATAARGVVTFYNASLAEQIIPAGTLLTGNDGVQIVTDQDAIIPSGSMATNGQATVSAHTLQAGPQGNIRAGDVYGPCCRLNVFAANSAFHGGQNARTYQTVKQTDIDTAVGDLKTSLNVSLQAALEAQVRTSESLITPLSCKQQVSADHQAGDEATQVIVTVNTTCTGEVYDTDAYKQTVDRITAQAAQAAYGTGYSRAGVVQTTIREMHSTDHGVDLLVQSTGTYVYQFSSVEIQHMKMLIAGKSKEQAIRLLLQTRGAQSVSISLSSGGILPTDTSHIALSWLAYPAS